AHAVLHHANQQAADDVDEQDQDAGDGIAADEFGGTVHGAVEIGLGGDFHATLARLFLGDQAGVEVGVDRHLLARQGVKGETRRNLGHSTGALGHHHEIDDGENGEDDDADGVVAADHKLAEGLDHRAGGAGAGVPFHQHHAGGGDVERQPEQRGDQQDGGEDGEV